MSRRGDDSIKVPLVDVPDTSIQDGEALHPFEQDWQADEIVQQANGDRAYVSNGHHRQSREASTSGRAPPTRAGFFEGVRQFFARGNDIESSRVNHFFTRDERERLKNFESIDYLAHNSSVYREWVSFQPHRRTWDRWFMMGSIGCTVGLLGYLLYTLIELLANAKYHANRYLLRKTNVFVAWLVNILYSTTLVFASSCSVVWGAPAAAGAGVAEVMAYLNGVRIPKVFSMRTLAVKFFSCATAVGSGLPVGPEGPMVHIGALIGGALSQGQSTALQCSTGLFTRFRNPKDKRDFVTAGAAVGIATAFGAPIGGLLFVFEEVASFWQHELGWQIFFACMVAVLSLDTFRSAEAALSGGPFGWFSGSASTVLYEVQTALATHLAFIGPAVLIGVCCGLFGILFTIVNVKVARLRQEIIGEQPWRRVAEPCIIIALFVTLASFLPLFFPCTPTQCFVPEGQSTPVCPEGAPRELQRVVEQSLEMYTCRAEVHHAIMPDHGNVTQPLPKSYNELATLISVPGEAAIRHLLTRGTHRQFGYASVLLMLGVYFCGAVWAAGSAVASGLFVPMLVIGACIGRVIGLASVDIVAHFGLGSEGAPAGVFLPPSPWAWIDPGAFALVGAGAFMGGVTRLTVSVAVIMMEVSNDVRTLIPILVAILVAKWVADAVAHPLYHAVLEVKCVPFLSHQPVSKCSLDLLEARALMQYPVVTLKEKMKVSDLREALRHNQHNGFPVVKDTGHGQVFVGLVIRDHLLVLLRRAVALGHTRNLHVPYTELNRQFVSKQALLMVHQQSRAVLGDTRMDGFPGITGHLLEEVLDLRPYINNSAFVVHETFSAERTYILFSTMGLRHLVVVDDHNRVKGMITRKDLMGYKLDQAVDRSLGAAQLQMRPISPTGTTAEDWLQ